MAEVLFYSKCRPQKCDAWPIAERAQRVFVGYPVAVPEVGVAAWRTLGCRAVLRDISDEAWQDSWTAHLSRGYRSQVTANRRRAGTIGIGSIVLVPRPGSGHCYAGEVTGPFELVNYPAWADEYFDRRRASNLAMSEEANHIGDIAQTWPVRSWTQLQFTAIPRWITYRLLSRNTIGIIGDLPEPRTSALETIAELIRTERNYAPPLAPDLEQALLDALTPGAFEHLIVALLQLESDGGTYWHHIGGSGDGGVDGIGADRTGALRGLLQCKWHYSGPASRLFGSLDPTAPIRVVAVLHGTQVMDRDPEPGELYLNRKSIVDLVDKHRDRLPLAGSLGLW